MKEELFLEMCNNVAFELHEIGKTLKHTDILAIKTKEWLKDNKCYIYYFEGLTCTTLLGDKVYMMYDKNVPDKYLRITINGNMIKT